MRTTKTDKKVFQAVQTANSKGIHIIQSEVKRLVGMERSTINRSVHRLVDNGMMRLEKTNKTDCRKIYLKIRGGDRNEADYKESELE